MYRTEDWTDWMTNDVPRCTESADGALCVLIHTHGGWHIFEGLDCPSDHPVVTRWSEPAPVAV